MAGQLLKDGYIADDAESRIRAQAPVVCRICAHYQGKLSAVLGKVVQNCNTVAEGPNSHVLESLLFDRARAGRCDLQQPL